jgi:hypothetical protein
MSNTITANSNTALTLAEMTAQLSALQTEQSILLSNAESIQARITQLHHCIDALPADKPIQFCGMQFTSERDVLENVFAWAKHHILKQVAESIQDIPDNVPLCNIDIEQYVEINTDKIEFSVSGREIVVDDTDKCAEVDDRWEDDVKAEIESICNSIANDIEYHVDSVDKMIDLYIQE